VEEVLSISIGSFLLPTFCDLHLHAPQFMYQGNGLDLPLMQWLDRYTFKAEESLDNNVALARSVYEHLARRLIENGTGAVLLFGTIKEETKCALWHFDHERMPKLTTISQPRTGPSDAKCWAQSIRRQTLYGYFI
jgi:cytosine/adenosine deaminase-related metal-dependent hydrolase